MAVGDLRYKFTDNSGNPVEIDVPAAVLRAGKKNGFTNRETIINYAYEQGGYDVTPIEKKADDKKKTTHRTRKPNEQKKKLIDILANAMIDEGVVNIINPERQVQVEINGVTFEFTLVQKRTSKK